MSPMEQARLGIIGGADGPTAVFVTGGDTMSIWLFAVVAVVVAAVVILTLKR